MQYNLLGDAHTRSAYIHYISTSSMKLLRRSDLFRVRPIDKTSVRVLTGMAVGRMVLELHHRLSYYAHLLFSGGAPWCLPRHISHELKVTVIHGSDWPIPGVMVLR